MVIAPLSLIFFSVPVSSSAFAVPANTMAATAQPIRYIDFITALPAWTTLSVIGLASSGPNSTSVRQPAYEPEIRPLTRDRTDGGGRLRSYGPRRHEPAATLGRNTGFMGFSWPVFSRIIAADRRASQT